tara:strand:+ start:238 stop:522 length:285 start_codon:yes stop_codon:yes gene_type:complete
MSHEIVTRPILITEPEYDWGDSISINTDFNYFYVPSIPDWAYSEFDGLLYEGVQYNWKEVDYRLSVDYNGVPEPAVIGLLMGLCLLSVAIFKRK